MTKTLAGGNSNAVIRLEATLCASRNYRLAEIKVMLRSSTVPQLYSSWTVCRRPNLYYGIEVVGY
jgi:hypothetical protein